MGARAVNPVAWLLWFLAAGAIPLTGRHPYYLALTLLAVLTVHLTLPQDAGAGRSWRLFAYVGSTVAVLSIGFNVLTVHSGDRTFTALPEGVPIIGGRLTYNALVYGLGSAMAISALLFAAATFNASVSHAALIRILPAPLQRLGVAGSIALTFVPQTMSAGRDIYDAQRARGRRMRGIGDARAFLVPLLSTGLERAFSLSEALETRAYGSGYGQSAANAGGRILRTAALALLIAALPLLATGRLLAGLSLLLGALAMLVIPGSRLRAIRSRIEWNRPSALLALSAVLTLAITGFRLVTSDQLDYTPFPFLAWPRFDIAIGVAIVLLLAPALLVSDGTP
jgi:energy-coupling factor transport system permease protein